MNYSKRTRELAEGEFTPPVAQSTLLCSCQLERGAVIHLDQRDYEQLEIEVVLGNTYHLMLRPGAEIIEGFRRFALLCVVGGSHADRLWWISGHVTQRQR